MFLWTGRIGEWILWILPVERLEDRWEDRLEDSVERSDLERSKPGLQTRRGIRGREGFLVR